MLWETAVGSLHATNHFANWCTDEPCKADAVVRMTARVKVVRRVLNSDSLNV